MRENQIPLPDLPHVIYTDLVLKIRLQTAAKVPGHPQEFSAFDSGIGLQNAAKVPEVPQDFPACSHTYRH